MKTSICKRVIAKAILVSSLLTTSQVYALNCGSVNVKLVNLSSQSVTILQENDTAYLFKSGEGAEHIAAVSPFYVRCKLDLLVGNTLYSGLVAENTTPSTTISIRVNKDGSVHSDNIDMTLNEQIKNHGMKYALGMQDAD